MHLLGHNDGARTACFGMLVRFFFVLFCFVELLSKAILRHGSTFGSIFLNTDAALIVSQAYKC